MSIETTVPASVHNVQLVKTALGPRSEPVGKTCRWCRIDRPTAAFFPCRFTANGYSESYRSCVATAARRDRAERERRRASKASRSMGQPEAMH